MIDYLQYLEEKNKENGTGNKPKKVMKLFNSFEYESIMKQSYFTSFGDRENDSKIDISVSVDNLIEAIDKAEKNTKKCVYNKGKFKIK